MKIVFHPEAYEEMIESARFYEEKDEGLGFKFLDAVEDTIKPFRGSREPVQSKGQISESVSFRAFHLLSYTGLIRIGYTFGAVMHQHRRPGYWRKRFRNA